jgi:hypothetical protein
MTDKLKVMIESKIEDISGLLDNIKEIKDKGLHELKDDVDILVQAQVDKMRSKFRKIVTGDEKKRVRDLYAEKKKVPKNMKMFDKLFFTFGVTNIAICQYFMMNAPRWYWIYHCFLLTSLLLIRFIQYRKLKYHYFLLDFCYFTNFCLAICRVFSLDLLYKTLFNAIFICSVGPLPIAVIVWKISFVFHDHEKVTSVLVHILPLMLCYTMRWHGKTAVDSADKFLRVEDFALASVGYFCWQVMYYVKTEILDKQKLDDDQEIQTSLRWITTDKKNPFTNAMLKLLRSIGIMGQEEIFVPDQFKTKFIFMMSQFIYTLLTFMVAPLVYYSKTLHLYAIGATFILSTYLGASYYIEIFSKRYQNKFDEAQNIAIIAAEAAFDSATSLSALEQTSRGGADTADLQSATLDNTGSNSPLRFPTRNSELGGLESPVRRSSGQTTPLSPLVSSSREREREVMRAATSAFVNEVVCADDDEEDEDSDSSDENCSTADLSTDDINDTKKNA